MEKKRKAYIFENCTWQLVTKAKNTVDKQHSPRSWPLLQHLQEATKKQTNKQTNKNFLIYVELREANKALRFFSEGVVIETLDVFFQTIDAKPYKRFRNYDMPCLKIL